VSAFGNCFSLYLLRDNNLFQHCFGKGLLIRGQKRRKLNSDSSYKKLQVFVCYSH
jgi:hypothetical protein